MEKGKLGVSMAFYATLAFLLVILTGSLIPVFMILGVTMIVEQNEWASRQVIQAVMLSLLSSVISTIFSVLDPFYRIPVFGTIWGIIVSTINSIVAIVILVFAIIALVNVSKGKEAGVPIAAKFANWAYGKVAPKAQPMYQQPVAPAPAAGVCAKCGAPLNGAAFCTKCGTPVR